MSLFKEKLELKVEEAEFKAQKMMGRFEPWQKWLIFVCLAGAVPGYFTAKAIAGRYYSGQYAKYLIEARPSFTDPKPLQIGRVDIASYGVNEYAAAVLLENKNLDLGAKNVAYEINFWDADDKKTAPAVKSTIYILPNQRKYLIAPTINSEAGVSAVNVTLVSE